MQCPQDEMLPTCLGLRPQLRHFLPQEAFLDIPLFSGWIFSGSRMTLLLPLPLTWPRRIHIGVAKCWTESEGPQGAASVSAAKEAVGPQGLLFLLGASLALYIEWWSRAMSVDSKLCSLEPEGSREMSQVKNKRRAKTTPGSHPLIPFRSY